MARTSESGYGEDSAADPLDRPGPSGSPLDPRDLFSGPTSWIDRLDGLTGGLASQVGPVQVGIVAIVVVALAFVLLRPGGGQPATAGLPLAPASLDAAGPVAEATEGTTGGGTPPGAGSPQDAGGASTGQAGSAGRGPVVVAGGDEVAVHVAGAVLAPGIHRLPAGSRVADAVAAAQGAAPGADLDRVNLAATLVDGSRIWIPTVGQEVPELVDPQGGGTGGTAGKPVEGGGSGGGGAGASRVNLNTADEADLEALPGVGPSTAAAIVAHRDANGAFRSVDDLIEVRGIGPAKLEQIRPMATV